ncbi:MAG: Sua5/YciO/YrdC/YwlC family protein [Mycoplasmataceae bacterium]|nr:Sua5/YciO/YrdC/YwlC family protein [Mycoplasmataceae bacterium]
MLEINEIFITTTDTLIGIGSKINNENLNLIYKLKKRSTDKKIVIVIGSIDQLEKIEYIDKKTMKYINEFWPGPTTLIINNQAYRMPKQKALLELAKEEGPFYLTSANLSGEKVCETIEEAKNIFPLINKVYNFGNGTNVASAIIDVVTGKRLR